MLSLTKHSQAQVLYQQPWRGLPEEGLPLLPDTWGSFKHPEPAWKMHSDFLYIPR